METSGSTTSSSALFLSESTKPDPWSNVEDDAMFSPGLMVQIRTHSIRKAHENIDKTLKAAEVLLAQFDLARQAEAKILRGPHEDLESYLEAIDLLRSNHFFSSGKGLCGYQPRKWFTYKSYFKA